MTYKYKQVAQIIKKQKNDAFKMSPGFKILLCFYLVGCMLTMSGLVMYSFATWSHLVAGLLLSGVALIIVIAILLQRQEKKHEDKWQSHLSEHLNSIRIELYHHGIKTENDISNMQNEISQSIEQADNSFSTTMHGIYAILGVFSIAPLEDLWTKGLDILFKNVLGFSSSDLDTNKTIYMLLFFLCVVIFAIAIYLSLSGTVKVIRSSITQRGEQKIVYRYLEDMKYISVPTSETENFPNTQ